MKEKNNQALLKLVRDLGLAKEMPNLSGQHGKGLLHTLAGLGVLDERAAIEKVAERLGIRYIDLEDARAQAALETARFVQKMEGVLCWKHSIVPLYIEKGSVVVAFADPTDYEALKTAEFCLSSRITQVIAEDQKIKRLLTKHFPKMRARIASGEGRAEADNVEIVSTLDAEEEPDWGNVESAPIVQLCNKILSEGITAEASDIHVDPGQHGIEIRYRIDGVLRTVEQIPKRLQGPVTSRLKLLSGMDIAERRRPQDGRLRVRIGDKNCDMRVSSLLTTHGEKLVLRILRSETQLLTFPVLGMPERIESGVKRILSGTGKMLLVTGPTGSGKTTTLYTCLNFMRSGKLNIQTIEDPIEYRVAGINQVQVNAAIGMTFASALRSVLRQDPDVIMLGEIRDLETADMAVQAAQTGHLVLSTLHANSAPAAIDRLVNLGIDPYLLSASIAGIIAQRLVRRLCPHCRQPAGSEYIERHADLISQFGISPDELFESRGCSHCGDSGFKGRIGLYSFLEFNETVAELALSRAPMGKLVSQARRFGFRDLKNAAVDSVRDGMTTLDQVRLYLLSNELGDEGTGCSSAEVEDPHAGSVRSRMAPAAGSGFTQRVESRKPRILLIEDDPDLRMVLTHILEREMYEVTAASNGREGLEKVYSTQPEVVLCDLMMPDMDGRQFLVQMRSGASTRDVPIIMLTAVNTEENETSLLDLGARDFISKTASSAVVLSRIRKALSS